LKLLCYDEKQRITFNELKNHPLMKPKQDSSDQWDLIELIKSILDNLDENQGTPLKYVLIKLILYIFDEYSLMEIPLITNMIASFKSLVLSIENDKYLSNLISS